MAFTQGRIHGGRTTSWCGSTPSASPATSSGRCAATAGHSSTARCSQIAEEGDRASLVYLRGHEGRGIGLAHKLRAYTLQERGARHGRGQRELGLPVDCREYGIGAQILVDLGVTTMRLMTNNPPSTAASTATASRSPTGCRSRSIPNPENIGYLRTKRERMGHLLEGLDEAQ